MCWSVAKCWMVSYIFMCQYILLKEKHIFKLLDCFIKKSLTQEKLEYMLLFVDFLLVQCKQVCFCRYRM